MDAAGKRSAAFAHRRRGEAEETRRLRRAIPGAEPGPPRALRLPPLAAGRRADFERAADLPRRAAARDPRPGRRHAAPQAAEGPEPPLVACDARPE